MATEQSKIPPAKSLIQGLRCIGYNFSTALADIIDNSISADAKHIQILSNPDDDEPYVVIFDDGHGMGFKELDNAMTLGSDRDEKEDSEYELGRFGLGLKSASFSQCLRLTVASKNCNRINAMRYDLKKIQEKNEWLLDILDTSEIDSLPEIDLLKNTSTGTLVIWQCFDKIMEESDSFNNSFINIIGVAKSHIELVFHRFWNDIEISFNGHRIEKRDPFLTNAPNHQEGRTMTINVDEQDIFVTPFVLPYANSLTEDNKRMLGNPKSIYDDQGFYIYRNKRLIIWGSWLRMKIRSEFNKLARVRVDIPSSLDSLWMLDVKKSSAKIPDKIKDQLQISIKDSIVRSKREVKYPGKKEAEAEHPLWQRIDLHGGKVKYEINREDNPLYSALADMLDDKQLVALNTFLDKIEEFIPKGLIVSDNADSLNIVNSDADSDEDDLIEKVLLFASYSNDPEIAVCSLLESQAFEKITYRKKEILGRLKSHE